MTATVDPAELCPRVAEGTRFSPLAARRSPAGRQPHYRIETADGRFFDVGYAEYVLLSQWDGSASLAETVSLAARHHDEALDLHEATALLEWSGQSGLLTGLAARSTSPLRKLNPFWLRVPLARPDAWLEALRPLARALAHPAALGLACVVLLAALVALPLHAAEIRRSLVGVLAPANWLELAFVWIGLKFVHELAHALVAKRYGVRVNEAGLLFILLAPCAYVDVTASWSLRRRRQRIAIAAAGMFAELVLAAGLVLAWPWIRGTAWETTAANVLFAATVASLLFNANPLMKFDGYYILSDALELPNLATRGQHSVAATARRIFFGLVETRSRREPTLVIAYGWAALACRVVISLSLLAAAYALAPGFGLPLAIVGGAVLLLPATVGLIRRLATLAPARRVRAAIVSAAIAAVVGSSLAAPWPFRLTVPAVVDDGPAALIRPTGEGFVETLLVQSGETVSKGEPLIQLRNEAVAAEVRSLTAELEAAVIEIDAARSRGRLADMQKQKRQWQAVQEKLRLATDQADRLLVLAPQAGRVEAARWDDWLGRHVAVGDELGRIVTPERRVLASLRHDEAEAYRRAMASPEIASPEMASPEMASPEPAAANPAGRDRPTATHRNAALLEAVAPNGETVRLVHARLDPRATYQPADTFLTATAGGPLAVRATDRSDEATSETLVPTFPLVGELPNDVRWPSRLPVAVQVRSHRRVGSELWRRLVETWKGWTDAR